MSSMFCRGIGGRSQSNFDHGPDGVACASTGAGTIVGIVRRGEVQMSQQVVGEIVQKAATDPTFRRQLLSKPDETLKPYVDRKELTDAEVAEVKAVKDALWEGFSTALARETAPGRVIVVYGKGRRSRVHLKTKRLPGWKGVGNPSRRPQSNEGSLWVAENGEPAGAYANCHLLSKRHSSGVWSSFLRNSPMAPTKPSKCPSRGSRHSRSCPPVVSVSPIRSLALRLPQAPSG